MTRGGGPRGVDTSLIEKGESFTVYSGCREKIHSDKLAFRLAFVAALVYISLFAEELLDLDLQLASYLASAASLLPNLFEIYSADFSTSSRA